MKKKIITLMLTLSIIFSMSAGVFAGNHDNPMINSIIPPFGITILDK